MQACMQEVNIPIYLPTNKTVVSMFNVIVFIKFSHCFAVFLAKKHSMSIV